MNDTATHYRAGLHLVVAKGRYAGQLVKLVNRYHGDPYDFWEVVLQGDLDNFHYVTEDELPAPQTGYFGQ